MIPANGWFEWVKNPPDPKQTQPFYIRPKDKAPLFFAGLAEAHLDLEADSGDGFVIITADSNHGMVDIHDRRPVVLSPEHAREWLDPDTSPLHAEKLASGCCRAVAEFEWYPVTKAVGNVRNQGKNLIEECQSASENSTVPRPTISLVLIT